MTNFWLSVIKSVLFVAKKQFLVSMVRSTSTYKLAGIAHIFGLQLSTRTGSEVSVTPISEPPGVTRQNLEILYLVSIPTYKIQYLRIHRTYLGKNIVSDDYFQEDRRN